MGNTFFDEYFWAKGTINRHTTQSFEECLPIKSNYKIIIALIKTNMLVICLVDSWYPSAMAGADFLVQQRSISSEEIIVRILSGFGCQCSLCQLASSC